MEDLCIAKCCHPPKIKALLTYLLKLVSAHWDATISRLVGDKGLRYKRIFLPFFTLWSHWTL